MSTLRPVPHIEVKTKTLDHSNEHFTTDKLQLTDTSEEEPRTQNITVLTCKGWNLSEDEDPPQPKVLVKLYMASERVQRVESPTLVLCYDGVTECGLYLALSILLERTRMSVEQECDVISAVHARRQSRREFVYSKAQFEYLYDAALEFVQDFGNYSNMALRPVVSRTATFIS
ncbi:receptor-type tyrosine-protein phosphatase epsilon-like [Neodiprion pinetum]|uniref:receptor-type tyrosine-protein phosphatase epsilon-like n=1 Tax=Neodiprion pinetum TaxID=441929 RepID=UPI001EDE7D30|nr:uncharacterized protein LOC124216162 [Neodiprion pinetum]